jgi:hypothetical protein
VLEFTVVTNRPEPKLDETEASRAIEAVEALRVDLGSIWVAWLRRMTSSLAGTASIGGKVEQSGQVAVRDSRNHRIALTAAPLMTGRWVRIEWSVDHIRGRVEVRLFKKLGLSALTAPQ